MFTGLLLSTFVTVPLTRVGISKTNHALISSWSLWFHICTAVTLSDSLGRVPCLKYQNCNRHKQCHHIKRIRIYISFVSFKWCLRSKDCSDSYSVSSFDFCFHIGASTTFSQRDNNTCHHSVNSSEMKKSQFYCRYKKGPSCRDVSG